MLSKFHLLSETRLISIFIFECLDEELEVNEMAAETLKARKSARAALRGNPAVGNGHTQPPAAVGPPSDDDDF